jgi:hypothetical protein
LAITPRHAASLNAGAKALSNAAAHMRMSGSSLSNNGSISGAVALQFSAPAIAAFSAKPRFVSSLVGRTASGGARPPYWKTRPTPLAFAVSANSRSSRSVGICT